MTSLITDVISTGSTIRKQHTLYYNIILLRQKLPDEKCFEKIVDKATDGYDDRQ